MKTIVLSMAAARQLSSLTLKAQDAIEQALDRYAMTGYGDVRPLAGTDLNRLRVGRYRVVFDEDQTTVLAIYIGKRETTTYRRRRRT